MPNLRVKSFSILVEITVYDTPSSRSFLRKSSTSIHVFRRYLIFCEKKTANLTHNQNTLNNEGPIPTASTHNEYPRPLG